ncbi:LANO_0E06832g1_1 [Lachancea nothofagi CBS 11611]|uniref:LANO_0E06832g1_1 n=1 Tax=Lachancea nothofagi CBS 11611 TaxID=1266666 RepID=A0A1G4JU52_9SACH|nr:LANO_0E06832g1_1 [Lachancea nothofagi CBS 11611]
MSRLYQQPGDITQSSGSFLASAPVELLTVKGYDEFIAKQKKLKVDVATVVSEDKSCAYVMSGSDVVATVGEEALEHLLSLMSG